MRHFLSCPLEKSEETKCRKCSRRNPPLSFSKHKNWIAPQGAEFCGGVVSHRILRGGRRNPGRILDGKMEFSGGTQSEQIGGARKGMK
ncbi:hypothetical protein CEXT_600091 [Caerostris extrusa]|uniref:Uncharacterized protein n=1 Tax=Caerostris extrusa TaxID=172846 RepID=A0AAV4RJC3_CAEEX|nr:hypothetical protein CEXT_600091 [Caerostris extrusa]